MKFRWTAHEVPSGVARLVLLIGTAVLSPWSVSGHAQDTASQTDNLILVADTSSPRDTLRSFLEIADEVGRRMQAYRAAPSQLTQSQLQGLTTEVSRTLDLSEVPAALRRDTTRESFVLLWEVLARVELPPLSSIPGQVDASRDRLDEAASPLPSHWRVPGTEITISRVNDDSNAAEFRFCPATIRQSKALFQRWQKRPYVRPPIPSNPRQVQLNYTGWMIPSSWVDSFPAWLRTPLFELPVWKCVALLSFYSFSFLVIVCVFRLGRRTRLQGTLASLLQHLTTPLTILCLVKLADYLAHSQLIVRGSMSFVPTVFVELAYYVCAAWGVLIIAMGGAEAVIASPRIQPKGLEADLLRLAAKITVIATSIALLMHAAARVGIPVFGLIASVGVTSLAFALAAKHTLENIIGSLNIYLDRPVRVGDFCRYGEGQCIGTIESIGVRSTRIRGLDRAVTTIPNSEFSQMHIVNLTKRDRLLFRTTLSLRQETSEEQLRFVLVKLRELLMHHPAVLGEPARVRYLGFADCSFDVEVFAYVRTTVWEDYLAVQEELSLRIVRVVRDAGTGFALPSNTMYFTRDGGLDVEAQKAAEAHTQRWLATRKMPVGDSLSYYQEWIEPNENSASGSNQAQTRDYRKAS